MNMFETRKLYLNQQEQKRRKEKPTDARTRDKKHVCEIHEFSTVISELSVSVVIIAGGTEQVLIIRVVICGLFHVLDFT